MPTIKVPKLGSIVCRLDVEITDGEWRSLKAFDNLRQAQQLATDLNNAGIPSMVSCACGSYEYGGCELCASELEEIEQ